MWSSSTRPSLVVNLSLSKLFQSLMRSLGNDRVTVPAHLDVGGRGHVGRYEQLACRAVCAATSRIKGILRTPASQHIGTLHLWSIGLLSLSVLSHVIAVLHVRFARIELHLTSPLDHHTVLDQPPPLHVELDPHSTSLNTGMIVAGPFPIILMQTYCAGITGSGRNFNM